MSPRASSSVRRVWLRSQKTAAWLLLPHAAPFMLSFPHKKPWSASRASHSGEGLLRARAQAVRWDVPTLQATSPLGCGARVENILM